MFNHSREGEVMSNVTTVGIDLAKSVFCVHGVDANGREVLRRTVRRVQLLALHRVRQGFLEERAATP
jgi:hypothetical protein